MADSALGWQLHATPEIPRNQGWQYNCHPNSVPSPRHDFPNDSLLNSRGRIETGIEPPRDNAALRFVALESACSTGGRRRITVPIAGPWPEHSMNSLA